MSIVIRKGPVSARIDVRVAVVVAAMVAATSVLAVVALCRGASWDTPEEMLKGLFGGDGSLVVQQWRLPRVVAAIVFGAVLGLAGAIFQGLTRNPLGSPDVIGLDAGAYTGALVAITVLSATSTQLAVLSVLGGLIAAMVIYVLSLKSGFSGLRLIVIGIAVNAMLTALNSWIVLLADRDVAIAATFWNAGSLNGVGWDDLHVPLFVLAALTVAIMCLWRATAQAMLGDELAITSGVGLGRLRLLLVVVGVGFTATVTAVAGPIIFIALAAPQIGRRLAGAPGVALLPAAAAGAFLLLLADLVAQVLPAAKTLPVGVITTAVGGAYLLWLLFREVGRP